jgi:hypothetical protein
MPDNDRTGAYAPDAVPAMMENIAPSSWWMGHETPKTNDCTATTANPTDRKRA